MADISNDRLYNQQINRCDFASAKQVVSHFGAMQAQDYAMAKWAVGLRMEKSTDTEIENALDSGEIIRTHLLRPTWHFVASEDLHWMLKLTAPNILRLMGSSNRLVGLDEKILNKSNEVITKAFETGVDFTRDELMEIVRNSGIPTNENRSSHILMHAEMSGIICNGKRRGKQHTYTLLDKWVKKVKHFEREEALAELAKRYFTSHCPATIRDFIWWSGLGVGDAKKAVALAGQFLKSIVIDSVEYFVTDSVQDQTQSANSIHLLPAFDEFLIAYKDRSASISPEFVKHAFTNNGIFKPIIVVNGQVVGTWKRTTKKDNLLVEVSLLQKTAKSLQKDIFKVAQEYGNFMQMKTEIVISCQEY